MKNLNMFNKTVNTTDDKVEIELRSTPWLKMHFDSSTVYQTAMTLLVLAPMMYIILMVDNPTVTAISFFPATALAIWLREKQIIARIVFVRNYDEAKELERYDDYEEYCYEDLPFDDESEEDKAVISYCEKQSEASFQ
jgi:hypothetical protein